MINVKFLVVFVCVCDISECLSDYCRICTSHTLCIYKKPGPGPTCKSYDKTATLTNEDVETIVNKINQRRNFVALGLARNLPSAANMNKMRWSEELAMSAQRWADQCDPAVRPDKKDICRDLGDMKVGQNIATVTGVSPGLNVKSFVETWFMQALDYTGNVAYYNESRDSKTEYFTQLIWAETMLVGCGKARFSIDDRGTMVDRFICNFAPKGNIRGKPVYTIGYAATQCKENAEKDEQFTGLCKVVPKKVQKITNVDTESSLLRIINLPSSAMKQDIDPIRTDPKNRESNQDVINLIRHQNLRHIDPHNTRGVIHHKPPVRMPKSQTLPNLPSNYVVTRQHTLDYMENMHATMYKTMPPIEQNSGLETANPYNSGANVRRRTFDDQCTRHSLTTCNNNKSCCEISNRDEDYCTRHRKRTERVPTTQTHCRKTKTKEQTTMHSCNSPKLTCIVNPTTKPYNYDFTCRCLNNPPENRRRIPGEYVYYDYFPNLALRDGETIHTKMKHSDSNGLTTLLPQDHNNDDTEYMTHDIKSLGRDDQDAQKRSGNRNYQSHNFPLKFVYPRERPKRQVENKFSDISFWKVDEYDKRSQKRTPRYTTLRNKIKRKFQTTFRDIGFNTEPITVTFSDFTKHRHDNTDKSLSFDELMNFRKNRGGEMNVNMRRKDKSNDDTKAIMPEMKKSTKNIPIITNTPKVRKKPNKKGASSKLSLREDKKGEEKKGDEKKADEKKADEKNADEKKSDERKGDDNKRDDKKGDDKKGEDEKTKSTTQMTLIGSFSPQSACTRRITCTWTAPKITDANGNEITTKGGSDNNGGRFPDGRTPWGHVENCTRRYTCSRLYYNRNVQASDTADAVETTLPDEDYCERRALNVKRRDSYRMGSVQAFSRNQNITASMTQVTVSIKDKNGEVENADCCYDDKGKRERRSLACKHHKKKVSKTKLKKEQTPQNSSYFLLLGKILQVWESFRNRQKKYSSRCHCNSSDLVQMYSCNLFVYLCILCVLN